MCILNLVHFKELLHFLLTLSEMRTCAYLLRHLIPVKLVYTDLETSLVSSICLSIHPFLTFFCFSFFIFFFHYFLYLCLTCSLSLAQSFFPACFDSLFLPFFIYLFHSLSLYLSFLGDRRKKINAIYFLYLFSSLSYKCRLYSVHAGYSDDD